MRCAFLKVRLQFISLIVFADSLILNFLRVPFSAKLPSVSCVLSCFLKANWQKESGVSISLFIALTCNIQLWIYLWHVTTHCVPARFAVKCSPRIPLSISACWAVLVSLKSSPWLTWCSERFPSFVLLPPFSSLALPQTQVLPCHGQATLNTGEPRGLCTGCFLSVARATIT